MADGGANVEPTATISDQVKEVESHCITEYQHNEEQLSCWCLKQTKQNYIYTFPHLWRRQNYCMLLWGIPNPMCLQTTLNCGFDYELSCKGSLCYIVNNELWTAMWPTISSVLISMKIVTRYLHNDVKSTKSTSHKQKWYHDFPHYQQRHDEGGKYCQETAHPCWIKWIDACNVASPKEGYNNVEQLIHLLRTNIFSVISYHSRYWQIQIIIYFNVNNLWDWISTQRW